MAPNFKDLLYLQATKAKILYPTLPHYIILALFTREFTLVGPPLVRQDQPFLSSRWEVLKKREIIAPKILVHLLKNPQTSSENS